jgi:hypothetical protein
MVRPADHLPNPSPRGGQSRSRGRAGAEDPRLWRFLDAIARALAERDRILLERAGKGESTASGSDETARPDDIAPEGETRNSRGRTLR